MVVPTYSSKSYFNSSKLILAPELILKKNSTDKSITSDKGFMNLLISGLFVKNKKSNI